MGSIILHKDDVHTNLICTSGMNDGMVNIFDMRTNKPLLSQRLHQGAVNQLTADMSGNSIFSTNAL